MAKSLEQWGLDDASIEELIERYMVLSRYLKEESEEFSAISEELMNLGYSEKDIYDEYYGEGVESDE